MRRSCSFFEENTSLKFDAAVEKPRSFEGVMVAVSRLVSQNSIDVVRRFSIYIRHIYIRIWKIAKVSTRGEVAI